MPPKKEFPLSLVVFGVPSCVSSRGAEFVGFSSGSMHEYAKQCFLSSSNDGVCTSSLEEGMLSSSDHGDGARSNNAA